MTRIFTENVEENDDAGDHGSSSRHGGVSVVVGGRSSLGGAIQRLDVGE